MVVGYFAQHQLDELNARQSPYDKIAELMPDATEAQKRAHLGKLGFGIDTADTPADDLSGGEKARLLFALATFHGPHLLILDEPTNHLDVDAREALIHALNDYEGAVILISHDRHLLEACADRLWLVKDGTVKTYDGDMVSYREECLSERGSGRASKSQLGKTGNESRGSRKEQRRESAARRAQRTPLKKAMTKKEQKVEAISAEIAAMDERLGDMSLYESDPEKANRLSRQRGELAKALEQAEADWLKASEAYEAAHV
jgi:ATP-binding cassette subfamily F protein 3